MIERRVLDNGIRVVMEPMDGYVSVSIGVWIEAGSADETCVNNGIAHVTEHMLFKGTKNRTARAIADEMTAIGGNLDAYTSKECTCYYTRTLGEYTYKALEIIADMLKNSTIEDGDLKKELGVILEEIDMYEDDADEMVHELLQREVWPGQPLGFIISGERDVVSGFSSSDVRTFMDAFYTGYHIVISVAGQFDMEATYDAIRTLFGDICPGVKKPEANIPVYSPVFLKKHKEIEQMHLDLAFDCIAYAHPDRYVLSVVNSILGGNLNSRLFQEVREERGLTYTIYSYGNSFKKCGLFQMYAAMSPEQTPAVLDAMFESVLRLRQEPVTLQELELTKRQTRTELLMATESPRSRMEANAKSWIYMETQEPVAEIIQRIEALTPADLSGFMDKYLDLKNVSIALIGNMEQLNHQAVDDVLDKYGILFSRREFL